MLAAAIAAPILAGALTWALTGGGDDAAPAAVVPSSTATTAASTSTMPASTTSPSIPGADADGLVASEVLPPDSAIVATEAWGEVFEDRIIVRLADVSDDPGAVADAVGGSVAAIVDGFGIVEIRLPDAGSAAITAAIEIAGERADVLHVFPAQAIAPSGEVEDRPCGPLDHLALQSGDRLDQYSLIGVDPAWRLIRAAGLPTTATTVGVVDGFNQPVGYHGLWVNSVYDAPRPGSPPGVLDGILGDGNFATLRTEVFGTKDHTSDTAIMNGIRLLAANGAKVINLSVGGPATPQSLAAWHTFLQDMQQRHPDVVMVAAAGNDAVDIGAWSPGGISEPNLITVGGLDHQGDRWTDTCTDASGAQHPCGSNYVGTGGEVTLAAISQGVFTGMSDTGEPVSMSGTSFAAPQVSAAVAILQSLDPTLTPAEIKQILADTAATEIADPLISDRIKSVDPALGGRVLRIDNAVWKVLSERLGVTGTREALAGRATVTVSAGEDAGDPLAYRIVATVPGGGDDTTVRIGIDGAGSLGPGETVTSTGDEARWLWVFFDHGASAQATITRTDTGACARIVITAGAAAPSSAGDYEGTFDWAIADAGFETTVPFTATVDEDGSIAGAYQWSGVYDYGEGVQAELSLTGSCRGTVDESGAVTCSGDFLGSSSVAGVGIDNPGTFTVDAVIDADGVMTGTLTATSDLGGTGTFALRGTRVG